MENKITISKGLEAFSGIGIVEERLLTMLGQYGPKIICQSVVDDTTLYIGSTLLYFTLLHSTMALLGSTSLYYTVPWLYSALLYSSTLYHGST